MHGYLKPLLLVLGFNTMPMLPAAAEMPLVPIASFFHHWDHHWYIWLPGDPVCEAVEIMVAERGPNTNPLVWVFFTERDRPKRQIHYYSDARIAATVGGQSRDMAFTMSGAEGGPRGVFAAFQDDKGHPIAIDVQMGRDARLHAKGAGLTNQMGHSGDRMLLVFFREKNAFAETWHVAIAGTDVAVPQAGQNHPAPFPAAYSSNIFVGGFPFGDRRIGFGETQAGGDAEIERFVPAAVPGSYQAVLRDRTHVELIAAADASLQYYRHRDPTGSHVLEISFNPPLPAADRVATGLDAAYRISLDGFRDLLAGTVHLTRQGASIILDWHYDAPDWTRTHPLRSTAFLTDGSVVRIGLSPMHDD